MYYNKIIMIRNKYYLLKKKNKLDSNKIEKKYI